MPSSSTHSTIPHPTHPTQLNDNMVHNPQPNPWVIVGILKQKQKMVQNIRGSTLRILLSIPELHNCIVPNQVLHKFHQFFLPRKRKSSTNSTTQISQLNSQHHSNPGWGRNTDSTSQNMNFNKIGGSCSQNSKTPYHQESVSNSDDNMKNSKSSTKATTSEEFQDWTSNIIGGSCCQNFYRIPQPVATNLGISDD